MQLSLDALVQWQTETTKVLVERVLWIDPTGEHVVTIDINPKNKKAWPVLQEGTRLEAALEAGDARVIKDDPYQYLRQPDTQFPKEHCNHRDATWGVIEPILKDKGGQDRGGTIFLSHVLGPLVAKVHNEKKINKRC